MDKLAPLTENEIRKMAETWFAGLNEHRPMVLMLPHLAKEGLEMRFPEATLTTLTEFEEWYQGVIRMFFDQDHILEELKTTINGHSAEVKIKVVWKAKTWQPPAAFSEYIEMNAYQTWFVKRSPDTAKPVIVTYGVDRLEDRL